jgi:hypothetical protein
MELFLFHSLVVAHIITGSTGAIAFWVPVIGRKGGVNHRKWGRVFTYALLATGCFALCMSLLTLFDPMGTHPHLEGQFDAAFIRGLFGWMMLHTAILTINLTWYGWLCVKNQGRHERNRTPLNIALQYLVIVAAIACAVDGWVIDQPLMMGIAVVGVATGLTNLWFIYKPSIERADWLKEHIKALVGAGISVYTAFMAFGSVRIFPEMALHPAMWSIPLTVGMGIIIWHRLAVDRQARMRRQRVQATA